MRRSLSILKPPPELSISDWADANRRLSSEASAEPGQWRTSRAEYQRGIMDAISDGSVESVVIMSSSQVGKSRGAGQCRRLLHRPGPGADHGGHADRAGRRGLVEGPLLADGAGHAVPRRQDRRPEVARRLEQDPAQALPGRAPDHRRRQRALGAREPADPHPALRRGRPLSVQRRRRGRPGQPREEAHGHLLEPQDRAGLDPDDPRPEPDRDRLRSRATSGSTGCRARAAARIRCWSGARCAGRAPAASTGPRRRATTASPATPPGRTRCAGPRSAGANGGRGRRSAASPAST